MNYELYEDTTHTKNYNEGDWTRYVYGTYSSSNPYNIEIDRYEYTKDLLNWIELNPNNQEYENYNGNIRNVDNLNLLNEEGCCTENRPINDAVKVGSEITDFSKNNSNPFLIKIEILHFVLLTRLYVKKHNINFHKVLITI